MAEIIGIDGLDGAGKTTIAKGLAELADIDYMYFNEGNSLKDLRPIADQLPPSHRFLYYLTVNLVNLPRLRHLRDNTNGVIVFDRTPLSTYAFHRAMGIDTSMYRQAEPRLWESFSGLCYVYASPEIRQARIISRSGGKEVAKYDEMSLTLSQNVHEAFLEALPNGAVSIDTSFLTPQDATIEIFTQFSHLFK